MHGHLHISSTTLATHLLPSLSSLPLLTTTSNSRNRLTTRGYPSRNKRILRQRSSTQCPHGIRQQLLLRNRSRGKPAKQSSILPIRPRFRRSTRSPNGRRIRRTCSNSKRAGSSMLELACKVHTSLRRQLRHRSRQPHVPSSRHLRCLRQQLSRRVGFSSNNRMCAVLHSRLCDQTSRCQIATSRRWTKTTWNMQAEGVRYTTVQTPACSITRRSNSTIRGSRRIRTCRSARGQRTTTTQRVRRTLHLPLLPLKHLAHLDKLSRQRLPLQNAGGNRV